MVKIKRGARLILYIIGMLIVIGTHIGLLVMGLPQEFVAAHAGINLFAGALILLGSYNNF